MTPEQIFEQALALVKTEARYSRDKNTKMSLKIALEWFEEFREKFSEKDLTTTKNGV